MNASPPMLPSRFSIRAGGDPALAAACAEKEGLLCLALDDVGAGDGSGGAILEREGSLWRELGPGSWGAGAVSPTSGGPGRGLMVARLGLGRATGGSLAVMCVVACAAASGAATRARLGLLSL